jgi:hypothetical protein
LGYERPKRGSNSVLVSALLCCACSRAGLDEAAVERDSSVRPDAAFVRDAGHSDRVSPPGAGCNFDRPDRLREPALVLAAPERVAVIRGDGSTFTLHEFDLPRPDARLPWAKVGHLVVRRNRVAVSASSGAWISPGLDGWQQWDEALLLELPGKVVWRRSFWSDDLGALVECVSQSLRNYTQCLVFTKSSRK